MPPDKKQLGPRKPVPTIGQSISGAFQGAKDRLVKARPNIQRAPKPRGILGLRGFEAPQQPQLQTKEQADKLASNASLANKAFQPPPVAPVRPGPTQQAAVAGIPPAPTQAPIQPVQPQVPTKPQEAQFDTSGRQLDPTTGQPVPSRTVPEQPEAPTQPQLPPDPIVEAQNEVAVAPPEQQQAGTEAINVAEAAYQKSLEISPEELSTQADLDRLIEATKKGYTKINGQTIPLEALLGQLDLVEQRSLDLAEPLESKMARLQAKRLGAQSASKFALERADKRKTDLAESKEGTLKEINGNLYRIIGGKAELIVQGTADAGDQFTLSAGQERYDAEGNLIAEGPEKTTDPLADEKKRLEIQKLQKGLEESVGGGYSAQIAERTVSTLDTAIADFTEVSGITGPFGRVAASKVFGTDSYDFAQTLETIKANIGFNELNAMRAASKTGGALGQVSERELTYLQSVLGSLKIGQSDERLLANLTGVRDSIKRWTDAVSAEGGQTGDYSQQDMEDARAQGYSEEQIQEFLKGSESQTSINGSVQIPTSSRLASVNNNPGNLRFAGQTGASQGEGGFARFPSPEAGYQALKNQINLDASRNLTLENFIYKYAPPTENATSTYLQQMIQFTGANANTPISQIDLDVLAKAMARKESSTIIK